MAELQNECCDLCGDGHVAEDCPMLCSNGLMAGDPGQDEVHLAFQSLPSWVQIDEEGTHSLKLRTSRSIPRFSKLGPLIAPHTLKPSHYSQFPLKICHAGGGCSYLDLSRKHLCNWLSLIPVGSANKRNLLVCQMGELLYYVAAEEIMEGEELIVWYAPYYQEKLKFNIPAGCSESLVGAAVVVHKNGIKVSDLQSPPLQVSPTLSKIVVGRDQVTFTHNIFQSNLHFEPTDFTEENNATYDMWAKGLKHEMFPKMENQVLNRLTKKETEKGNASIELLGDLHNSGLKERIVTFNICAAIDGGLGKPYKQSVKRLKTSTDPARSNQIPLTSNTKKKLKEPKAEVCVAKSDIVKQLPARALGAHDPRPWICQYCGENFTKVISFARHLKAHLLWLAGRCHVCHTCGHSFSSALQLSRHQEAPSKDCAMKSLTGSRSDGEVAIKSESLSDEESMVDDPSDTNKDLAKITARPTDQVAGPHNCQICTKHFNKPEYLLRHLRKHTGDFTCQRCLKVFARKEGLQKHNCPDGAREKSVQCSLCDREFLNPVLLQQHYVKHNGSRKCVRCNQTFLNTLTLEKHLKSCPSVEVGTLFQCGLCGKDFMDQKLLDRHMLGHSQQYVCAVCAKPYSSTTSLAHHLPLCRQSRQLATTGQVLCEECGEEFTDATEFRAHYLTHTHPFCCSCCKHRFRTRVGYEVHVCEVDQQCDQCNMVFRSVQALNRHSAIHGPPPLTCASCRRSYYRKESLDRHVCCVETEVKDLPKTRDEPGYNCTACGAVLATRHSLNTHMRSIHGGSAAKSLHCDVCGKQFHRKDVLRDHQAVHTPPSFPCPTCKKLFKTRKSLEVHSQLHLGIKRFACKYCNKKYHQKVNLSRHERSHMPRGAVKCQYCGTHCLSTIDLKEHLLSHTLPSNALAEDQEQAVESKFAVGNEAGQEEVMDDLDARKQDSQDDTRNDLGSELLSQGPIEPELKILGRTKDGLQTEQRIFSGPTSVIDAEERLGTVPKILDTSIKGIDSEVSSELKTNPVLRGGYGEEIVHQMVPVITSSLSLQETVSDREMDKHTVLVPQSLSNLTLATNEHSFDSRYILPTDTSIASSGVTQNLCSPSVLSVAGPSVTPDVPPPVCRLSSGVLLETSTLVPVTETSYSYQENCQLGQSRQENMNFPPDQLHENEPW